MGKIMIDSRKKLVLASASPRRRELLSKIMAEFDVCSADADERLPAGVSPCDGVKLLAQRKANAVFCRYALYAEDVAVLGADTVVAYDGKILGKPKDEQAAKEMLRTLSGKTHEVFTGVCVVWRGGIRVGSDRSLVTFRNLTDEQIEAYVASGSPMDKAGAYGIQDGVVVEGFSGSYSNIVGLPLELTEKILKEVMENAENSH
jgi:septum formation protein